MHLFQVFVIYYSWMQLRFFPLCLSNLVFYSTLVLLIVWSALISQSFWDIGFVKDTWWYYEILLAVLLDYRKPRKLFKCIWIGTYSRGSLVGFLLYDNLWILQVVFIAKWRYRNKDSYNSRQLCVYFNWCILCGVVKVESWCFISRSISWRLFRYDEMPCLNFWNTLLDLNNFLIFTWWFLDFN